MRREHDFEPTRGLPGDLPPGERLLWQGAPRWTRLACDAFHVRAVGGYFGVMLAWRAASAIGRGVPAETALAQALAVAPVAAAGVAILLGLAWLNARTTVYTITSKRVVLRFGAAIPKAINLPFAVLESGALKAHADGSGDIALSLKGKGRVAFLQLWPHTRPWRVNNTQPSLRSVADAATVAGVLAQAMKAQVAVEVAPVSGLVAGPVVAAPERASGGGLGSAHPAAA